MSFPELAAIAVIRDTLARTAGIRLALLFGSASRGTAGADSDVDLAIDADPTVDLLAVASALSLSFGREVQIVALRDAGVPLLEELLRDAVVAYQNSPNAAAAWRTRALLELDLDRPGYARMRDAWLARVARRGVLDGQP